jgi:hypothetical protein
MTIESDQISLTYQPNINRAGVSFRWTDKLSNQSKDFVFDIRTWQSNRGGAYVFSPTGLNSELYGKLSKIEI